MKPKTPASRSAHRGFKAPGQDLAEGTIDRGLLVRIEDGTNKVLTAAQRSSRLEELLAQPFPLWTEFYVLDRIHRVQKATGLGVSPNQILIHAVQKSSFGAKRMETVLDQCIKACLLECHGADGPEDVYRLTQVGRRCLEQAKQERLRLWELNRGEDLATICASVALQGGDAIDERVQEALERFVQMEKEVKKAAGAERTRAPRASSVAISPLWSGLLVASK